MAYQHKIYYERAPLSIIGQKLEKLPRHPSDFQAESDLKPWHCVALAKHVAYGLPFSQAAKSGNHSGEMLGAVARSPAGQAFIAKLETELRNPVVLVKKLMESDTFEMWIKWREAFDWAYEAKDSELLHKMAKDIGLQPVIQPEERQAGPTTLSLHLSLNELGQLPVKTTYKVIDEPDYMIEDSTDPGHGTPD